LNPNSNQYDLDVVQLSRALPGFLNNQLINVLANRGVPLHVFEDIRRDAIESIADVLWGDWENDSAHHIQDVESMRGILSSMMSDSNQNGITTNDIYDSVLQVYYFHYFFFIFIFFDMIFVYMFNLFNDAFVYISLVFVIISYCVLDLIQKHVLFLQVGLMFYLN